MDPKEAFIVALYPAARRVSQETGMAWQTILAQAAQETGWGQHQLPGTHNLFNIKAGDDWHGPTKTFKVWEIEHGKKVWVDAAFRVYTSWDEALRDRVEFLQHNSRYARAGLFAAGTRGDLRKEADALQRAGYATDPNYADNIVRVFDSPLMQRAIKAAQVEDRAPKTTVHEARLLQPHTRGTDVRDLQQRLSQLGYRDRDGHALAIDGDFGANTLHAVEVFQRDHDLTADGKVGPDTRAALAAALQSTREATAPHAPGFDDPAHPQHAMYAALQQWLPAGTSDARLAEATAACHVARIDRPEDVTGIYAGTGGKVFIESRSILAGLAMIDTRQPAPPVSESLARVQAHVGQEPDVTLTPPRTVAPPQP